MRAIWLLPPVLLALVACSKAAPAAGEAKAEAPAAGGLTPFQQENGIGPVTEAVELAATPDHEMAEEGEEVFEQKCGACHKMNEKYVGPALGGHEAPDRRLHHEHDPQSPGNGRASSGREAAARGTHDLHAEPGADEGTGAPGR